VRKLVAGVLHHRPKKQNLRIDAGAEFVPEPSAGSAAFANASRTLGLANTLLLAASSGGGVPAYRS